MARLQRYSNNDRINDVARYLINKAGWEKLHNNKHWRLRSPDGKTTITVPHSPSDHRSGLNWMSHLRHTGVIIPTTLG
jgi:predicted RNA binding protein YcfA (HicA-like mRNA interferase family)